jgi:hypothetical protein
MELNYLKLNHTLIFILFLFIKKTITESLRNPKNQCEDWTKPKVPLKIKNQRFFQNQPNNIFKYQEQA